MVSPLSPGMCAVSRDVCRYVCWGGGGGGGGGWGGWWVIGLY